ncbi:MAG: lysophospholipid acyltransferase family protein [Spirochaetales bacterium]|uniref:1-acyl-sn-glycerol-3-phosphate acyltransferase n=1 Tax=Candidatus Thalassospirochaeta sargassi TaxID=3119039 RepID=A0AAJ1IE90_9SPIO|nr:lysophospholipid acyltransferase family protein [Spirochaetales bacterium]
MKDFFNTITAALGFLFYMVFSAIMLIPLQILKLPGFEKQLKSISFFMTSKWGHFVFWANHSKMIVKGRENLPDHERIIYIANHQAYADIPLMMAQMPTMIGFIAKKELGKVPVIGPWMKSIHCILVDRGNFRKAMREIEVGITEAGQGRPKVIFPEGTRSHSAKMNPFKPGSVLLAAKAGLTIVPVTINNTYKTWEEHNKIRSAELHLTIHPCIETEGMSEEEQKALTQRLWHIIADALPNKGE